MADQNKSLLNILPKGLALQDLISSAKDWALFNGISMRARKNFSENSVIFLPFTLLPSLFPKREFNRVVQLQTVLNELIHNVAYDHEFLKNTLQNTIEVDDFTKKLFEIYETIHKEGFSQEYSVGLLRSDYMIDDEREKFSIKQIETNTIAVSFAGLGFQIESLHKFVLERLGLFSEIQNLPENNSINGFCSGLVQAWKMYNNPKAAILVVVENVSYNICDQRSIEFGILKLNPEIVVLRRTLTELADRGHLSEDKKYFIDDKELAVVYYRTGYSPDEYNGDREWQVRFDIERSKALKCPSIQYHLAGTKKVQQVLASEKILSKFLSSDKIKEIVAVFTGLYSLDLDPSGNEAVEMALENPEKFVLKPQREGGGNNVYGTDISLLLSSMKESKERTAYVLMNRIMPPVQRSLIIRPDSESKNLIPEDVVSELGVFGVIIGKKDKIVVNNQVGHLIRTKSYLANEGGIAAGAGALDSPLLY